MTKYLAGRRFQPAAMALMIVTFSVGWGRIFNHPNEFYAGIGYAAIATAAGFMVAWGVNKPSWMRWAFLASFFIWIFAAGTSWTILHSIPTAISAIGWAILSGGSFWYESQDEEDRDER
jgi:hypothetical protein